MSYNNKYEFKANEVTERLIKWIKNYFVDNGPDSKAVIGMSGGKDSTVCAALCAEALGKERVVGVKMPCGTQVDIDFAKKACDLYCGESFEINIGGAFERLFEAVMDNAYGCSDAVHDAVITNMPARLRMTALYGIAACVGGRVANTCNLSEDFVGYSTKFGDSAGDFSPLQNYTVEEVLAIGKVLGVPQELLYKVPDDGMSGKTDEEKLGFTYKELDRYLREDVVPAYDTFKNIMQRHERNIHKMKSMPAAPFYGRSAYHRHYNEFEF